MPVRRARRRVDAGRVVILMTGAAFDRVHTVAVGAAANVHGVRMAVIALTRKISAGVAIHAARMAQYRRQSLRSSGRARRRAELAGFSAAADRNGQQTASHAAIADALMLSVRHVFDSR